MSTSKHYIKPLAAFAIASLLTACAGTAEPLEPIPPAAVEPAEPAAPHVSKSRHTETAPAPVAAALVAVGSSAPSVPLNPAHPDSYVVQPGDTLWDISQMFLLDPLYWQEIWYVNPQVENPHLIYPGDTLNLVYVDGQLRLQLERQAGLEKLSPRIRAEMLEQAIPTIPYEAIRAFLSRPTVLDKSEINNLPYIVDAKGHLAAGAGFDVYVRGIDASDPGDRYNIVHVENALVDPDTKKLLGYNAIYVGEGTVRSGGDPSMVFLNETDREALQGDRLIPIAADDVPMNFIPRPPTQTIDGRIISLIDALYRTGQYQIVVLNRGADHGLEPGNVLSIYHSGPEIRDNVGNIRPSKVKIPDTHIGELMIFRAYDKLSYALIMHSTDVVSVMDVVRNPG